MKILILVSFLVLSHAYAQNPALTSDFQVLLSNHGISPRSEQTFCYQKDGLIDGYQPMKLQRIASLSKILTTFFASEMMDLHQSFETKIYIAGDRMHIEGSLDPYWEEEKILLLLQALNQQGYSKFKTVTFDRNFLFSDVGFESHADITPAHVKARLQVILSNKSKTYIRGLWQTVVTFAAEEGITLDVRTPPSLVASSVSFSEQNPLLAESPVVLVHRSLPFHRILKSMNVMSKNHVAQNIFRTLSSQKSFGTFMQERGFDLASFKIYNGSGLPVETGTRKDNLASCELILKVSRALEQSLERQNLVLSDLMAVVGGRDLGSLRNRFFRYPETHQSVLSKTGTLKHTSSLAGFLLMDETVPFAILNHTTNIASAKSFQDEFVTRMFHHLGQPQPLDYQKISIFPWDGTDFLEVTFNHNIALAR